MAITPTRTLEIEFDAGVWTSVSADTVQISSKRGRNRESGAFETGRLIFTLRNDTRKYDPDNTAGPYYGKLRPNRRVRLRATYSAVTYDVFLGYIDRIAQVGGGPNDATAVFEASDFFKFLARAELPDSVYLAELADVTPVALWPLNEPSGSATVTDVVGGVVLTLEGSAALGGAGIAVRDPGSALTVSGSVSGANAYGTFLLTGRPMTIELLYQHTAGAPGGLLAGHATSTLNAAAYVSLDEPAGNVTFTIFTNAAPVVAATTGVDVGDGAPHHIVAIWKAGGAIEIWVDGVNRTSGTPSTTGTFPTTTGNVLIGGGTMGGLMANGGQGRYQYVAFYNSEMAPATITTHNSAARTPWTGDDPGTRLTRIFELVATPGSYVLGAGEPTLQSTSLGGDVLSYAQKVEETALGALFVARNGDVTFVGRNSLVTGAYLTSKATLVDDDSGAGIPYRQADADVDESIIVTRATVSRDGSIAVTYFDTAAKTEFGWLDETHDGLLHASDSYSASYAQWIVNTHKVPSTRVDTVALELTANPTTMYPAILALELGDQVTWKRKPQNVGSVVTIPMRVEAISHETGPHYWRTGLQLSPFNLAAGLPVGVWDVGLWDQSVWGI